MEFSPRTRTLIEKILAANKVPEILWGAGFKKMAGLIEPVAKKNGHHFIRDDDVIEAMRELTPADKKQELIEGLKKAGLDTDSLFPEWL